ncbi:MAG: O-antigen ligase family protein [Balneolaceae bacterium]
MKKVRLYWSIYYVVLAAIVIATSVSISGFTFFDQKKIVQTGILLLSSFLFFVLIHEYQLIGFGEKFKIAFYIFFALLIFSSLIAHFQGWALLQVGWYVLLTELLLLASYLYLQDPAHYIKIIAMSIFALCMMYCFRVYADYISGILNDHWTVWPQQHKVQYFLHGQLLNPDAYLGFSHVRFFNHIQTWTLPLLVFSYLYFREKLIPGFRYFLLFFISSWWMLVFAADARGTMLASALSLLFVIALFKRKTLEFNKIYLSTVATGLFLYLIFFLIPNFGAREILTRFGDSGRIAVWLFALKQIVAHPFLGLGPMHFSYMGIHPPWSTPHNFILQSAAEWGIPAVVILVSLVTYGFYKFIKQSQKIVENEEEGNETILRIALTASFSAALMHSMVSGIFNSSLSQLLFTLVGGWMIGEYFLNSSKQLFISREKKSVLITALILLLLGNSLFIGYEVASQIPHLNERQQQFFQKYHDYTLYPRFWNQGMIYKKL